MMISIIKSLKTCDPEKLSTTTCLPVPSKLHFLVIEIIVGFKGRAAVIKNQVSRLVQF